MTSIIKKKLTLVSQLHMLNKATSDDADPTPGYLFDQICNITFSSESACEELEDYLLGRLQKKSPHTKLKSLRIIKHLVEKGHDSFKKDMQRRSERVREAITWKGEPDPLHGDTFNAAVRATAKVVMEAIYDSPAETGPRVAPGAVQSAIARDAFGGGNGSHYDSRSGGGGVPLSSSPQTSSFSSAFSSSASASSMNYPPAHQPGQKMWGFGNTPVKQEPQGIMNMIKSKVNEIAEKIPVPNMIMDKFSDSKPNASGYSNYAGTQDYDPQSEMASSFAQASSSSSYDSNIRSNLSSSSYGTANGESRVEYRVPVTAYAGPAHVEVTTDTQYEQRLVDDITAPGGVRVAPTREALSDFVNRCQTLDCHKICNLLEDKIANAESDRQILKSLHVLKGLAQSEIVGIRDCILEIQATLQDLSQDNHQGIRERAQEILNIVHGRVAEKSSGAYADSEPNVSMAPSSAPYQSNLLDLELSDGGSMYAPQQQPVAIPPPVTISTGSTGGGSGGGLFSGMSLGAIPSSAAAPAPAPSPAYGAPSLVSSSPATMGGLGSGGGGLFSGMSVSATIQQQPLAPSAPAVTSVTNQLDSLLLGPTPTATSSAPVLPPQPAGNLLLDASVDVNFDPLASFGGASQRASAPAPAQPTMPGYGYGGPSSHSIPHMGASPLLGFQQQPQAMQPMNGIPINPAPANGGASSSFSFLNSSSGSSSLSGFPATGSMGGSSSATSTLSFGSSPMSPHQSAYNPMSPASSSAYGGAAPGSARVDPFSFISTPGAIVGSGPNSFNFGSGASSQVLSPTSSTSNSSTSMSRTASSSSNPASFGVFKNNDAFNFVAAEVDKSKNKQ